MPLTQFLNNHLKKNLIRLITPEKQLLFFLESLKIIFTITNHAKKFVLLIQFLNNYLKKNLIRLITPAKQLLFSWKSLKIIFAIKNYAKKFVLLIQFLNNYLKKNLIRLITPAKQLLLSWKSLKIIFAITNYAKNLCFYNQTSQTVRFGLDSHVRKLRKWRVKATLVFRRSIRGFRQSRMDQTSKGQPQSLRGEAKIYQAE